jgi:uncharacterized membrane protein
VTIATQWQGPLPSPEALRAFEDAHPGAAAAILAEFKNEAEYRRTQEDREARLRVRETGMNQLSALLFGLAALGMAAFAEQKAAVSAGGFVGGGGIVIVFIKWPIEGPGPISSLRLLAYLI